MLFQQRSDCITASVPSGPGSLSRVTGVTQPQRCYSEIILPSKKNAAHCTFFSIPFGQIISLHQKHFGFVDTLLQVMSVAPRDQTVYQWALSPMAGTLSQNQKPFQELGTFTKREPGSKFFVATALKHCR